MLDLTGYKLTFSDEFNTRSISQNGTGTTWADIRSEWRFDANSDIGFGHSSFVDPASGYDPFVVKGGTLAITAIPDQTPYGFKGSWESGLITTQGGFSQTYGYFEMRANLADKVGAWDAFWLLPTKPAPNPGHLPGWQELDVIEHYGDYNQGSYRWIHTTDPGPNQNPNSDLQVFSNNPSQTSGFHTYGMNWQKDTISFYFDGQFMGSKPTPSDMHGSMYMLANLTTQGSGTNNADLANVPITMEIDYIRAYSNAPDAAAIHQDVVSAPDNRDPGSYGATVAANPGPGGGVPWEVHGGAGDDIIGQGNDVFAAGAVATASGGAGNDVITLTGPNTGAILTVYGGAGSDTIQVANTGLTLVYGGQGAADPGDGADSIGFSGTGSWGIWGNAGADTIVQGARAFDAATYASVFGGKDGDSISLGNAGNRDAHFAVYGGENGPSSAANGGIDSITVINTGPNASTIIFGGQGAADLLDGDDTIIVDGSGGTVTIFGNAGNDTISARGLQDATTATIYGGRGSDSITLTHAGTSGESSLTIFGGEDGDEIQASGNGGSLTIYGGIGQADRADGADTITLTGTNTGMILVMANGGADAIHVGATGTDAATRVRVYGGGGDDSISVDAQADGAQRLTLVGDDGADAFIITKGTGQTISIDDFAIGGGDTLVINGMGTGRPQVTLGFQQTLKQALDAASAQAGTNKAAVVSFGGDSYVVLESTGDSIFDSAVDQAIKLTGITDVAGILSHLSMI
ncbi:family 16 glycosylhydrolase [Methylobacterium sp. J-090]|uniref:family 16 glycosylhydrolase n=1 Tax=Methylobacterium sp. J-090 TaxID=2836666 RepID=UPI001FBBCCC1|nr:family 16 glycosylhydrolase [Methylobacterium sp. J-090]MCJ2082814.1 family 16 glycosylhydrolase [Methylobacterium sp. J-090]